MPTPDEWDDKIAQERNLREKIELVLNSVGDGLYQVDTAGNCVWINRSALDLLGYRSDSDLIGRSMHEAIHHTKPNGSPYPRQECPIYQAYKDGLIHNSKDDLLWRKDGKSFPAEYTSRPVTEKGLIIGAVVCFRDITEKKIQDGHDRIRISELTESVSSASGEMVLGLLAQLVERAEQNPEKCPTFSSIIKESLLLLKGGGHE